MLGSERTQTTEEGEIFLEKGRKKRRKTKEAEEGEVFFFFDLDLPAAKAAEVWRKVKN